MNSQNNAAIRRAFQAKGLNDPQDWFDGVDDSKCKQILEQLRNFRPRDNKDFDTETLTAWLTKNGLTRVSPRLVEIGGVTLLQLRRNVFVGDTVIMPDTPQFKDAVYHHINLRDYREGGFTVDNDGVIKDCAALLGNRHALYLFFASVLLGALGKYNDTVAICGAELVHAFLSANAGWGADMDDLIDVLMPHMTDITAVFGCISRTERGRLIILPVHCKTSHYEGEVIGGSIIFTNEEVFYVSGNGMVVIGCPLPDDMNDECMNDLWANVPDFLLNAAGYSFAGDHYFLKDNRNISLSALDFDMRSRGVVSL